MLYSIGTNINNGRFGKVYRVTKDNKMYAAKVLPKHRIDIKDVRNTSMIQREIANHYKVNGHPHVVKLHEVIEDWGNFYIVEEFCHLGDLHEMLQKTTIEPDEVKLIIRQCLQAICACHKAGFIFGDLKPANILVADDHIYKICDFGGTDYAKDLYSGSTSVRGTPAFMAPECFVKEKEHGFIVDMWSVGMLAYTMLFDRFPFNVNCTAKQFADHIGSVQISYDCDWVIEDHALDFIQRCLERDAKLRMTPEEGLKHPWLR